MIASKLQVSLLVATAGLLGVALAWLVRDNSRLRVEASQRSVEASRGAAAFQEQLATQERRVAAAETELAELRQKAAAARSARPAASPLAAADAVKDVMARASQLVQQGKQQEAVDVYVAGYREAQAARPGSSECQRLMSALRHLGRTYPTAMTALGLLRDAAMAQFDSDPANRELPFEIALLNERLGEGHRTIALYDSLPSDSPARTSLARIANASFIEARRYSDALLGKPLGEMLNVVEIGTRQLERQDPSRQLLMRKAIIDQTLPHIEVLTGAGQLDDARMLTEKLLAFDHSEATQQALQGHLARAVKAR